MDPRTPLAALGSISVLNVGTRILLKDVMDQYLRTLGDFRTHYASNLMSAMRVFQETPINIVICEVELVDGSAYRLFKELGGPGGSHDDLYFILALEERSEAHTALSEEIEADAVLVKPFSATDLKTVMERYGAWKVLPKDPWRLLLAEADLAIREKRFRDAEANYKDALASAPGNHVPFIKVAHYYMAKPEFHDIAEGMLKKALSIKPDSIQALSALGSLYLSRQDLGRASELLSRAQTLSPLNPDRALELVRLFIARAAETCKSSIRVDAGNVAARVMLGKLLTLQKDYVGAVRELERTMPSLRDTPRNEAQTFAALARKLGGIAK